MDLLLALKCLFGLLTKQEQFTFSMQKLWLFLKLSNGKRANRLAVTAYFFIHGLCFSSWASRIPSIQGHIGLSDTLLGAILLALPVGSMIALVLAGWLIEMYGSKTIVTIASCAYSLMLIGLGLAKNVETLSLSLLFFGLFGNLLNISINTQATGIEKLYGRSVMGSFHGMWSLAGFAGAALGTWMIGASIQPYQHFIGVLLVSFMIIILCRRSLLLQDYSSQGEGRQTFLTKPEGFLLTLGLIAFCSMMCEGAMYDWGGVYFKKVLLAKKAWIGAGYTAFTAAMSSGRFISDMFVNRYSLKKTLEVSGILIALGLSIAIIFPYILTGVLGFLLVGFGISSVVPLVYGAAAKQSKSSPGAAIASVSSVSFCGFLVGPPLIGFLSGLFSLRISLAAIALLGFCIAFLAMYVRPKETHI